ncbi:MAG: type transport system ATP-binding protein [Solirubrobacteraceae bacterium]|jgi:ABC-type polysaccharide/polyol phosphate transport system ATPase subunit|nr:type transport system ATP-binding protein [Solirubrobacteraceae bacterium]
MAHDPVLVVDGVSKHFRRPTEQMHTFKERALHPFRPRSFDSFTAVRDLSFHVDRGEFFGIVGRNGSGKSTMLKMMAGIYQTNGGEIWVNGRLSTFIELGVGFNPDLAARDNVILNAIMLGLGPAEARERYERVIDFAELREFESLKLKNYSSGMHVRLAFSVMVQVDADILLIDEVLAVGDAAFQQKCFDEFNRFRDDNKTIVLVTHDMGAVRQFCDRAMLLERGSLIEIGDPEHVGASYMELNFQGQTIGGEAALGENTDHNRHGDGRARITDVWIEGEDGATVETVAQGHDVIVRAIVEFSEAMEHPTIGLKVEDANHRIVFAANSVWDDAETGVYGPGDKCTVTLRFRNVFTPERYYVTPAVASRGATLDVADERVRVKSFVSTGPVNTGGLVDLDHDLVVEPGVTAAHEEVAT